MTEMQSDRVIRTKLRDSNRDVREQGMEELIAKYRYPVCGLLLLAYEALGYIRLISEVPDIWQETTLTVWEKAGPDGTIHENGNLWSYLLKITYWKRLAISRKLSRSYDHIDTSIEVADLEIQDATRNDDRYDDAHTLYEVLECHYRAFTRQEIWILEIMAELCLPSGELDPDLDENLEGKLTKMEAVVIWYNQRVDEYNRTVAESERHDCVIEKSIDVKEARLILNQARRKLRRLWKTKGVH